MNNDWIIKKTLDVWQEFVSWMLLLLKNKAPEDEDEDLTLNQMQFVLKAWKKALAEISKTNSSSAAPSDATNLNEFASGPSAPVASNPPTSDNTVQTSNPTTSSTKNDNSDSNQPSINICVSPDYVLISPSTLPQYIDRLKKAYEEMYPTNQGAALGSDSYAHIINLQHFNRIKGLLEKTKGKVLMGGRMDEERLKVEPMVILVNEGDVLLESETFGLILTIVELEEEGSPTLTEGKGGLCLL
ncbi:hypothetical protein GYMLUDRAFT_252833 [Collybiopsis luxurians FD-317 M1]|uniref:Aldehyde dehydrogenase domain-containing protein n=1 Tax=Collybiopsis luxurians FD-317 M1 TaxID=944289 RepID=A0A0D0C7A0_9AGAR|nr:hypothetical protein GYMLUDRAFT_252833 [Collybiopsis luxurians FD-317 M1]